MRKRTNITLEDRVVSTERARTPQSGEILILSDGREFRLSHVEAGPRGRWFTASAVDGCSTLQGNLELEWDPEVRVWRQERFDPQALEELLSIRAR